VRLLPVHPSSQRRAAAVITAVTLLLSIGLGAQRAGAQTLTTLNVATIGGDVGGEIYYAKDLGMFKKVGLDVTISDITNGGAISSAVASGALDIGYSNAVSTIIAHDKGLPFMIIGGANMHETAAPTAGILAVGRTSAFHSAKDLNGKTIATIGLSNISYVAVRAWLDKNGGDSSTVHFLEVPFGQMEQAIQTGRVDAASIDAQSDPTIGKPGDPLRVLGIAYDGIGPRFLPSVWFTSADWIAKHPDEAKKFASVMRDAANWANVHRKESAEILVKYSKNTMEEINSVPRVSYAAVVTPDLIQPVIDDSAKYGLIKAPFPAAAIISPLAR
jgi:NitT/TauT family transport system substrate-binding protein